MTKLMNDPVTRAIYILRSKRKKVLQEAGKKLVIIDREVERLQKVKRGEEVDYELDD